MTIGLRDLPSLNAFVVLEAVVRNLGFTAASRELQVTQAAVSQQVKALERELEVQLIHRERPRIRATAEAELIARAVRDGIDRIEEAVGTVRQRAGANRLSVAAVTALSSFWLMPRLPRFFVAHPEIEVNLVTRDREIQRTDHDFDVGILFTAALLPGFDMYRLFGDELIPVCTPDYLRRYVQARTAEDLAQEHLLHLVTEDRWMGWPEWFEHLGVEGEPVLPGTRFTNYILVIQAALEGQGIALGWRRLVNPMLERGELVRVTEAVTVPEPAYHLAVPGQRASNRAVKTFTEWLFEEAARDW